jgi:septal ring factor EnvC (AmiA/AmiB activator)
MHKQFTCPTRPSWWRVTNVFSLAFYILIFISALVVAALAHDDRYTLRTETERIEFHVQVIDQRQRTYNEIIAKMEVHIEHIKESIQKLEKD